ncbi:ArnT family glycosyltransferase [Gluconobacter aidae]|uniref:Glycosyltransferase RgtA/B/C/D-like domain-containing protein n=1 Tax=Gluconobacter aidae TaxID=2662454 RepID=A0A7X1SRR2_9PROT|nr:hypothetical protein [Gluconobacter aidae]MQR99713.1 hypothetical protein [Gluconobacter aidae]
MQNYSFLRRFNQFPVAYCPHLFLFLAALAIRFMTLGDPNLEWDEEFYLFGGGRLLHGHLPYIDFWDRKPIGLFLIYAVFHLFGAYRIIAYQIGALLALWGTALLVRSMALMIAPASGALVAALIYEIWPSLAKGEGGQSPIFYNLLVAGAMYLILDHLRGFQDNDRKYRSNTGIFVMILFGLAIQIKYTVIFEGIFAGIYLIYTEIRSGYKITAIALDSFIWIFFALLPTIAVFVFYILIGHGHDWIFANISSVFLRTSEGHQVIFGRLIKISRLLAPFFIAMGVNFLFFRKSFSEEQAPYVAFLGMWAAVAFGAFVVFGTWYIHYILPLLLPFSIQIAPLFYKKFGRNLAWLIVIIGIVASQLSIRKTLRHGGKRQFLALEKSVDYGKSGCIFIYSGPIELYDALPYCRLTSHPFPSHFSLQSEEGATGMDPLAEIRAVLAQKPAYIISHEPESLRENLNVRKTLYDAISRSYFKVYTWGSQSDGGSVSVYERRCLGHVHKRPDPEPCDGDIEETHAG